jgi:hypothetical protein
MAKTCTNAASSYHFLLFLDTYFIQENYAAVVAAAATAASPPAQG